MKWVEEEIEIAKHLLKNGFNFYEIGDKLGRSRDSVRNKMNRLGVTWLSYHDSHEVRECLNCHKSFNCLKHKRNKFCSSSCSATYNNKLRCESKYCLNCNKETKNRKYCNHKCNKEHQQSLVFFKIENGDTTLHFKNYKKYLIHKYGEKCMECGWGKINKYSNTIPIELEHIDGNSENNNLDNLKLLCPNCHSLTPTYKALNTGSGRYKRMERYYNKQSH
jgi:hypothetical protein